MKFNEIQWAASFLHKAPNLYVEVQLDGNVQRTRVVKRNVTPTWNETLWGKYLYRVWQVIELRHIDRLAKDTSSFLSIQVKHSISKPLSRDPCVGKVDIDIKRLLCDIDQGRSGRMRVS
jgi:hypothetical protein